MHECTRAEGLLNGLCDIVELTVTGIDSGNNW